MKLIVPVELGACFPLHRTLRENLAVRILRHRDSPVTAGKKKSGTINYVASLSPPLAGQRQCDTRLNKVHGPQSGPQGQARAKDKCITAVHVE